MTSADLVAVSCSDTLDLTAEDTRTPTASAQTLAPTRLRRWWPDVSAAEHHLPTRVATPAPGPSDRTRRPRPRALPPPMVDPGRSRRSRACWCPNSGMRRRPRETVHHRCCTVVQPCVVAPPP